MAMNGSTWRAHPFEVGTTYIALQDMSATPAGQKIVSGQSYRLKHIGHSHYDGASVFTFECLATQQSLSWWWYDSEPDDLCAQCFRAVA